MNTQSNAVPHSPLDSQRIPPAVLSETRPMYWSIRREIWENRSIYIAPLGVAAVYLLGFVISVIWLPHNMREVWMPHTMREMAALKVTDSLIGLAMPYTHAAMLIMLIAFLVGIFYSLDALHGERRDRSILFWKSLPVSDRTTVLSKAAIPLVVLPLFVVAVTVALQQIMRLLSITVLVVNGGGAATLWTRLPLSEMELVTALRSRPYWCSGTRPSIAGFCWSQAGRGARHSYGRWCRGWRLPRSRTLRSTLRIWDLCCSTACLDSPRPLSTSRIRMASRLMRILFRWHNSLPEGS